MITTVIEFENELGNMITIKLEEDDRGATVTATGPTSTCEHTWTPVEAQKLGALLSENYHELANDNLKIFF